MVMVLLYLFRKFSASEADELRPRRGRVGSRGELDGRKLMTNGNGEFFNNKVSVRTHNRRTEKFVFWVGEDFDEAGAEVGSIRGRNGRKREDGFSNFYIALQTIVFSQTDACNSGISIG